MAADVKAYRMAGTTYAWRGNLNTLWLHKTVHRSHSGWLYTM